MNRFHSFFWSFHCQLWMLATEKFSQHSLNEWQGGVKKNLCLNSFVIIGLGIMDKDGSHLIKIVNPLSANPTKWSNTLKRCLPTNCLSVFYHLIELAFKGLTKQSYFIKSKWHHLASGITKWSQFKAINYVFKYN